MPKKQSPAGAMIVKELGRRGWSRSDLAHVMRVPLDRVSKTLRGEQKLTPSFAKLVQVALGLSAEQLLTLESIRRLQDDKTKTDGVRDRAQRFTPRQDRVHSRDGLAANECPRCGSLEGSGLISAFWVRLTADGGIAASWRQLETETEIDPDSFLCRECGYEEHGGIRAALAASQCELTKCVSCNRLVVGFRDSATMCSFCLEAADHGD